MSASATKVQARVLASPLDARITCNWTKQRSAKWVQGSSVRWGVLGFRGGRVAQPRALDLELGKLKPRPRPPTTKNLKPLVGNAPGESPNKEDRRRLCRVRWKARGAQCSSEGLCEGASPVVRMESAGQRSKSSMQAGLESARTEEEREGEKECQRGRMHGRETRACKQSTSVYTKRERMRVACRVWI